MQTASGTGSGSQAIVRRLGVVAALGLGLVLAACSKPAPEPEPVRSVRTLRVQDAQSAPLHEFAAEIKARVESKLSFRVPGKVVARPAELGQAVKAGQLLAQLDPEDLRQQQEAAKAAVASAQANADVAEADFRRFKELRDQGFISSAELDRRAMLLKTAQAQLDQAKAQAVVQRNQAAYSSLSAPAGGVVVGVDAEIGSVVAAGSPVLRLALDGPRDAVFAIAEDALPAMRQLLGRQDALQVRVWGSASLLPATLRELAASADPVTRTYLAKADLGPAAVQLGQTAAVLMQAKPAAGVTRLPLTAIAKHQDHAAVWVVESAASGASRVRQVPVTVSGADGNEALVSQGLQNGMLVVTAGVHVLTPGQAVRLLEPATQSAAK